LLAMRERIRRSRRNIRPLATPYAALLVTAVAFALAAGCGGGSSSNSGSATTESTPPPAAAPETTSSASAAPVAEAGEDLGAKVFAQRCALCHGPDGHGNGPGAAALNPKPRNFHDKDYMSTRTDEQLLEVIHKGKGAMPRWEGVISEAEIQAALKHVRELGEKP
jgi:mono/diheme cytochrome c family protein